MKASQCFSIWWIIFHVASSSFADNSTPKIDQWSSLKWALIGGAIGIVISVLISIAYVLICRYKTSMHRRYQDTEGKCDEQEPLLTNIDQLGREGTISKLQKDLEQLQHLNQQLLGTQKYVKTLLENWKDHLYQKLKDFELKRKKNKDELQSVEKKLTEREAFDGKELLLGQKEGFLQSQWKLDEQKNNCERQILNIEKVLEPIEIQITSTMKGNYNVDKTTV